jgi:NADPH:quinone reductase-like Zn-dependent oxidoreductase
MRAYRFDAFGGLDHLNPHEEPMPAPGNGEVLVRVHAVALNFRDIAIPTARHPVPHQPGLIPTSDASGEVVAVGSGVDGFKPGDRVISTFHPRWPGGRAPLTLATDQYGRGRDGWLVEYKAVSTEALVALPDAISHEQGATLPCAALTAWSCLGGPYPMRAGDVVLTLGTGGVSLFAVQLAKACGARVIATTSSAAKADLLRSLGADAVLNYRKTPAWGNEARVLTGGRGVDRVIEVGGPGTLPQSLLAIASGSEIALVGFLDQTASTIDFAALFRSGAHIRQVRVGDRAGLVELLNAVVAARINPVIDRVFGFDNPTAAFQHLDKGEVVGKVVIKIV